MSRGTSDPKSQQNGMDSDLNKTDWDERTRAGNSDARRKFSQKKENSIKQRKPKSVSFHSATSLPQERKIASAQDCIRYMMQGSTLIKVRANSRQYHRYFTISEDMSAIRWTPSSKKTCKAQVPIAMVKEIRAGKNTDVLRNRELSDNYPEECAFSILYGENYECLDLVASTPEESNIWVTGMNALIGASKSPEALEEKQALRDQWLKDMFDEARPDPKGYLDEYTTIQLVKKINSQINTVRVKQKIQEFDLAKTDSHRGRIDKKDFIHMFKEIATRPEIYFLLIKYASKDYLSIEDLRLFLEGEQGMTGLTTEKCWRIIESYEPSPEARKNGQLLIDGFTQYLLSEECDIFDPLQRSITQDMSLPLTHYFISTSYNTYLLEDQLKGPSSVEGYIRTLASGCRCIKVDVWESPGSEDPVVYHGNTLTSKLNLKEVLKIINDFAFVTSEYPVIIHLENHCSVKLQRIVAQDIKQTFGSSLYIHPSNSPDEVTSMSPKDLIRKILINGKKLSSQGEDEGEVTDEDEGGETKDNNNPKKIKLCRELSDLVSLCRVRFTDFNTHRQKYKQSEMASMSESQASKLAHSSSEEFVGHNKTYMIRVYPNGSRVDSSNYNPQDFWNCGCQMVAMNFQTPGQMMDIYDGRFRQNGDCGYILKPLVMRDQVSCFNASTKDVIPGVTPQVLRLKIISGQQLPRPRGSTAKAATIDPYITIQIFGIPADCQERRTRTVSNEGSNPLFEENFEFVINLPELAIVRFVVLDDDYIGDDFIGQCTLPFECLQTGYRHVRLLSNIGEPLENSSLFVHVAISNKRGGGRLSKKRSRANKGEVEIRTVGIKQIDDLFKATLPVLQEAVQIRGDVDKVMGDLQAECGLGEGVNISQCLRVIIQRLNSSQDILCFRFILDKGTPVLKVEAPSVSPALQKSITTFEKASSQFQTAVPHCDHVIQRITQNLDRILSYCEELENHAQQAGLKGKKLHRARDHYAWNVRSIKGQIDLLTSCQKTCKHYLQQVTATSQKYSFVQKDKSPTQRERPKLNILPDSADSPHGSLGRSSGSPVLIPHDLKPKSILKKSNSNIEQGNIIGYVNSPNHSPEKSYFTVKSPLQGRHSYELGYTKYDKNTAL